jgi:8-oxo-dGTP pyrophosphatase MutT (NUDIX family)
MRHAAAVLVLKANRVLGFLRFDREGVSIPCGNVEETETPAKAAIRETREETGYTVTLSENNPYAAFDTMGGCHVTTFRGTIVGEGAPTTPNEGRPVWASPRTLVDGGPYSRYNEAMLRHFGVEPWPLVGKFHSHLTLKGDASDVERAAKLTGGKVTYIDLARTDSGRTQTDAMVTHHYVTGVHGLEDEHDVLVLLKSRASQIQASGIDVERVKLEYEPFGKGSPRADVERALLRKPYTEVHVKLHLPDAMWLGAVKHEAALLDWHPSRNPFGSTTDGRLVQFVNRRLYGGVTLEYIDQHIDTLVNVLMKFPRNQVEIAEIKTETAIYDSNDEVDAWWMR